MSIENNINIICNINGNDYDLSEILQYVFNENKEIQITSIGIIRRITKMRINDAFDFMDKVVELHEIPKTFTPKKPLESQESYDNRQAEYQRYLNDEANKYKCPYCRSTNIKKIGLINRSTSVGLFGLASKKIGKQWECKDCKSAF